MTYTECPGCDNPLDLSGVTDEVRYSPTTGDPWHLDCYNAQGEK